MEYTIEQIQAVADTNNSSTIYGDNFDQTETNRERSRVRTQERSQSRKWKHFERTEL